jgi:transcription elongation factor Elf1
VLDAGTNLRYSEDMSSGPPSPSEPPPVYSQPPQATGQAQVQYPHAPPPPGVIPYAQLAKRKYANVTNCPRCGCPYIDEVRYTWWGGVLGPSMMSLMNCRNCKLKFNAKTMRDASTAITVYAVIACVVPLIIALIIWIPR